MKNSQKGFIVPVLLGIIALLVVGGGIYIYENKKAETPINVISKTSQSDAIQNETNTNVSDVAVKQNISNSTPSELVSKLTKNIICTLSGNRIDDSSNQNGLTFFAKDLGCAALSGWAPNNPTDQSLTFNGVAKNWKYVLLSFDQASFSLDGKHFAYTASNIPLPSPNPGGDWKPQRFIVSDSIANKTYDDVYYPQYSQDGKHLGYCAQQNGQYLKVVDGVETMTNKDDYFKTCDSLFGFKQGFSADHSQEKQGEKSLDGKYTIRQTGCTAKFGCQVIVVTNNTTGISKEYSGGNDQYGNASNIIFSSDGKHFAWLIGPQVYVDGIWNSEKYDETFNLNFSSDSKSITYNARNGKNVYFVTEIIN